MEMLYHDKPFGVHQFWTNLHPPNATALRVLFDNCPEALQILPADIIARRPDWRGVLCDLQPTVAGCHTQVVTPGAGDRAPAKGGLVGRRRREARRRRHRGAGGLVVESEDESRFTFH